MKDIHVFRKWLQTRTPRRVAALVAMIVLAVAGCGPSFEEIRMEGQNAMAEGKWGAARELFRQAGREVPEDAENLHDLGASSMLLARKQFELGNEAAAFRELDWSIEYFTRSIEAHPGYRPSIIGKNRAQELKGQFEDALGTARWAASYVGPSARQYLYLGAEFEERGDLDSALLRYRQARAMEPRNPAVHKAIGMLYDRAGNRELAVEALMESLRLDPSQPDVAARLREMGEPVPAVDTGERVPIVEVESPEEAPPSGTP